MNLASNLAPSLMHHSSEMSQSLKSERKHTDSFPGSQPKNHKTAISLNLGRFKVPQIADMAVLCMTLGNKVGGHLVLSQILSSCVDLSMPQSRLPCIAHPATYPQQTIQATSGYSTFIWSYNFLGNNFVFKQNFRGDLLLGF